MIIEDSLYTELIDYLARRPWFEVNPLIAKLAQANRPRIEAPDPLKEEQHGN